MKNLNKLWSLLLSLVVVMAMVSCDEDEPEVPGGGDPDDPGLLLGDGFYLKMDDADPISGYALTSATC